MARRERRSNMKRRRFDSEETVPVLKLLRTLAADKEFHGPWDVRMGLSRNGYLINWLRRVGGLILGRYLALHVFGY